ncbi:Fc receptor-like protein 4 isoform X2 [Castor canadensis]|uniref:Fc receptor-like protein 4 n=1 Tax=Castor canadensis TaxID=51338 RepID=A0A8B7VQL1_CASCN|nr:Fc receptor-like protein 4 [Castor canadensis]
MLLWASLLVLAPLSRQFATAPKPVISLHPPWTTVFKGETVNLTCNGFHFYAPEKIKWYFGNYRKKQETKGNTLEVHESGEFRCQAQGSPLSNSVRLTFSTGFLILQAPHSVFEGDTLVLRCQRRGKEKLIAVKYIWNGKILYNSSKRLDFFIPRASLNNSGNYQCIGSCDKIHVSKSNSKVIKIQELFPYPKLKVTTSQPTEGNSVNLSCETHLHPERLDTPLHFIFFRDSRVILSGWNNSSELQIPIIWREDSGLYGCGVETVTHSIRKHSPLLQISVQRIPVSQVSMETNPPGGHAVEGEILVLVCFMVEGTGITTFSWHREDTKESLGRKIQRSQRAELQISVIKKSDAGQYYCTADNSYGPIRSAVVNVIVKETSGNRSSPITAGTAGGTLSILLLAIILLFFYRCWRKSGDCLQEREAGSPPSPDPGESSHSIRPAQVELQLLCGNVQRKEEDLVYSDIQTIQSGEANTSGILPKHKHASIIYSEVKTQPPDNSEGKFSSKDEDTMEYCKNVLI